MKTYLRYYKTFGNVPDEVIPELKRLNLGWIGIMKELIPCDRPVWRDFVWGDGRYCERCNGSPKNHSKQADVVRHIVVAYDEKTDKAVGWTVVDNDRAVNLFVAKRARRKGIAAKMATHMLKFLPDSFGVWNSSAKATIERAVIRSKFKKRVRLMPGCY